MNQAAPLNPSAEPVQDSGLRGLSGIAAYYRIAADPAYLAKELALSMDEVGDRDLVRAAKLIGLKARVIENPSPARLIAAPVPALLKLKTGGYCVFGGETAAGDYRIVDPITRIHREIDRKSVV